MFAFPNMFHFFAQKFAGLGGRRFTFALVFTRPFDWFFLWHGKIVSPLARYLDVTKTVSHICTLPLLQPRDANFADHTSTKCAAKKKIVIPRRARIGSAHAHNSDNYSNYSVTRRSADLAV